MNLHRHLHRANHRLPQNNHQSRLLSLRQLISCILVVLSMAARPASAQVSTLPCNLPERMNLGVHTGMRVTTVGVTGVTVINSASVISSSTTDNGTILLGGSITVIDDLAGTGGYPAGTFAGFEIEATSILSLLSNIQIKTYLGSTPKETITASASILTLLSGSSRGIIGFKTTSSFDRISIGLLGVASIDIYNAVFQKFCGGPSLVCNTPTYLTSPKFPVVMSADISGAACVGCSISSTADLIDSVKTNFMTMNLPVAAAITGTVSVTDNDSTYPAGTFAGFDIASPSLLNISVLSSLAIVTYNNGSPTTDSVYGAGLLSAGTSILSGSGRRTIGFITKQPFDEVRLVAKNTVSVALGALNIYGAVIEKFCHAELPVCNTLTPLTNPGYPVMVNGKNTGFAGVICASCSINNSEHVVDSDLTNHAEIVMAVSVIDTAHFSVVNVVDSFRRNSFAGFDIETNPLLAASVVSNATIKLYNNGVEVQSGTGNALVVGAASSLLSSTTRQIVGIVADTTYDEVKISFHQFIGANLGTIKIYNAVFENTCAPNVLCNSSYLLNAPDFPTVINSQRSGVTGIAGVAANIQDIWNVVSSSTTDHARIDNLANVAATSSISVLDPVATYPAGTFAGFSIRRSSSSLVLLTLLNHLKITVYNNGAPVDSASAGSLLELTVLARLIGTPTGPTVHHIGFKTSAQFDEIRMSVSSLVGVAVLGDYLDVFGAFIDTRTSVTGATVTCIKTLPDINATFLSVATQGNVQTNDLVPSGTTYGAAIGLAGNPTTTVPTVSSTGSYTFNPTIKGVYQFVIPVCVPSAVTPCPTERLTITVLDKTVGAKNPPVVNTDIAAARYNNSASVRCLANDAIGTPGTRLDTASVTIIDLSGSVTTLSVKGGTAVVGPTGIITYTPPAGLIGKDTLRYRVCDNQPTPLCGTAFIIITMLAPDAANITAAADDYKQGIQGSGISGNVLINDTDPESDLQFATARTVSVPGQYAFVLNTDGSYSFTPDATFSGPVGFSYEVCDNNPAKACVNATAYLLVSPLDFDLPLLLENFSASMNQCSSVIRWKSASEKELKNYALQYSTDGKTWLTVATVYPKGNNSQYEHSHKPANGQGFYRLQLNAPSGDAGYSAVQTVQNTCKGNALTLYPNPANDRLMVTAEQAANYKSYEITDITGRLVQQGVLNTEHSSAITISGIEPGIYMLKLNTDGMISVQQFQILRN